MKISDRYLELGITSLARAGAHRMFHGHFGASLIAAYYMDQENDIPEHVREGLVRNCEAFMENHPELFEAFPEEAADPALLETILDGLKKNLAGLRHSGHGLAFGVEILKALQERPDLLQPSIVAGLAQTFENCLADRPNRYYTVPNYFEFTVDQVQDVPEYHSVQDLIETALGELETVVPDSAYEGQHYFFTGEPLHGVTHGHALWDLDRLGYGELAKTGFANHRIQMHLDRLIPASVIEETEVKEPAYSSLFDPTFWAKTHQDPHAVKFPYATLALLKQLPEEQRARAEFNACKILTNLK